MIIKNYFPKEYNPNFDYETEISCDIRGYGYFRFFPKRDANKKLHYSEILLFLIDFMMYQHSDNDEIVLHSNKTYCFLVGVYSYLLSKGGLTKSQAEIVDKIYEERRRDAVENLAQEILYHKNRDFLTVGGVQ